MILNNDHNCLVVNSHAAVRVHPEQHALHLRSSDERLVNRPRYWGNYGKITYSKCLKPPVSVLLYSNVGSYPSHWVTPCLISYWLSFRSRVTDLERTRTVDPHWHGLNYWTQQPHQSLQSQATNSCTGDVSHLPHGQHVTARRRFPFGSAMSSNPNSECLQPSGLTDDKETETGIHFDLASMSIKKPVKSRDLHQVDLTAFDVNTHAAHGVSGSLYRLMVAKKDPSDSSPAKTQAGCMMVQRQVTPHPICASQWDGMLATIPL